MARPGIKPETDVSPGDPAPDFGLAQSALDDALAAEYVLGLVDPVEAAEAERRLQQDLAFAARVAGWQARMAEPAVERAEPVSADQTPTRQSPTATNQPRTARRAALWSGIPGFIAGAAVALALVVATVSIFTSLHPGVVVRLAAPDDRLVYEIAHFDRSLKVTRVAGEAAPPGKVHQLWLISPGEAPVSLGLLDGQSLMIDRAAPAPGTRFAVSLEPEGGAAAGRPTGPMILMTNLLR